MRAIEFRFKEEEGAADYTEMLAMTMRRYAHQDCLRGDYLFDEYAPEDISEVLSHITPRACVYVLSDHGFDVDAPGMEREPWFKVPFTRETVDPAKIAAWGESAEPYASLSYPPRTNTSPNVSTSRVEARRARRRQRRRVSTTYPPTARHSSGDRTRVPGDAAVAPDGR